jgi:beta-glucanase (GH16 family)
MDPVSGNGREWKFGYMEARISFDPTLGPQSQGFPAVWASSAYNVLYGTGDGKYDIWPELDIFEAFTSGHTSYTGDFWGTLHQWQENSVSYTSTNNFQPTSVDWSQWHIVAVLWMQGHVTWYLDGAPLMTQKYSSQAPPDPLAATKTGITPTPAGVFNILDTQDMGMALILGSSPGWPMNVDWVRVWQE